MTNLKEGHSLDIEEVVNRVLAQKELTSTKISELERSDDGGYSLRVQSTGERDGYADIKIQQENGELVVSDVANLPKGNQGFEPDIALLKKMMFYDEGAGNPDSGVRNLMVSGRGPYVLSFRAKKDDAVYALHNYLHTSLKVMDEFFEGMGSIDLAFSLARERAGII